MGILDLLFGSDNGEQKESSDKGSWKAGREHTGDDKRADWKGVEHKDVYHVDERGERDRPHRQDMKISFDPDKKPTDNPVNK